MQDWERMWAPYDETTYDTVLNSIGPDETVLDIGAGDLRLARRLARRVRKVYALEINSALFPDPLPTVPNLHRICGDARTVDFPKDVTVAVLLMRHCRHFSLYLHKLQQVGCSLLLTNARWGLDVEKVDVQAMRKAYTAVSLGWYACGCGATGFVSGAPEKLTPILAKTIHEVQECPHCSGQKSDQEQCTLAEPVRARKRTTVWLG